MNITIKRTDSSHADFEALVRKLDTELKKMNGEEDSFFAQFNKIDEIKNVIILYANEVAVGCGAFKEFEDKKVEIKRMFINETHRRFGLASKILEALEYWAKELNFVEAVLETGNPKAVLLYEKSGYQKIPNYGQYVGVDSSVCMSKLLG